MVKGENTRLSARKPEKYDQKNCLELKYKIYLFHTDNGDLQSRIKLNQSTNRNNNFVMNLWG